MELRLFNDTKFFKIYVDVNGISYIIKRDRFLTIPCPDNCPVTVKLMLKYKSFILPPLDWPFDMEAFTNFIVNSTYILNLQGGTENQFSIKLDEFSPDKYVLYIRPYIDDPLIKNNCTYEIPNMKKSCKRAKRFNFYTAFLLAGIVMLILHFTGDNVQSAGEMDLGLLVIGAVLTIWGFIGRIKINKKLKKYADEEYARECFLGHIEEAEFKL